MARKIVGINFLHNHPGTEAVLKDRENHVVVDKSDWKEIIEFFEKNPAVQELFDGSVLSEASVATAGKKYYAVKSSLCKYYVLLESTTNYETAPELIVWGVPADGIVSQDPNLKIGDVVCTADDGHIRITNIEKPAAPNPMGACEGPREKEPFQTRTFWLDCRRRYLQGKIRKAIDNRQECNTKWLEEYNEVISLLCK